MGKTILFLANHFITLFSFRREMIEEMCKQGHTVYLSLPESEENGFFEAMGCRIIPTAMDRRGANPLKDMKLLAAYRRMIKEIDPDIIFSFTIKPNIYGTMASNASKRKNGVTYRHVCNITGTGATFLNDGLISRVSKILYRHSIRKCYKVFFQNRGDRDFFIKNSLVKENWDMLPGSGVNLEHFQSEPLPEGNDIRLLFIGRVMKLKGIDEYLEAARRIRKEFQNTSFLIAGWNEEMAYQQIVSEYEASGDVQYIGFQKNIKEWIRKCHCTILPSHGGEGVPNVLLESAAMGRICIGSRIAGTEDVIEDGVTGYLFETGNIDGLVAAIRRVLLLDHTARANMGQAGRAKVEREFDRNIVIRKYLDEVEKA